MTPSTKRRPALPFALAAPLAAAAVSSPRGPSCAIARMQGAGMKAVGMSDLAREA